MGVALVLGGMVGGFVLGIGLAGRDRTARMPMSDQASPAATAGVGELAAELDVLRRTIAAEEARLRDAVQARAAAEAKLAELEREMQAADARRAEAPPRPASPARTRGEAAPAPAPAPAPAAASGQARVIIHYRAGSEAAREAAQAMAESLRAGGFELVDVRSAPAVPAQRVVRYFHGDDAAAAARLAGRLGRGWAIQDFRAYEPSPEPQTLEVWVP